MENVEFLKAMLVEMKEEMLAKIGAKIKSMQRRNENQPSKSKADREETKAERKDDREHMQQMMAKIEIDLEEIRTNQENFLAKLEAKIGVN
jgi:RNA polymerase-binding transcription factor DksA